MQKESETQKKNYKKNRTTNIVATLVQEIETKIQKTNNQEETTLILLQKKKSFVKLTSTPPYQTTTHTYDTEKKFRKKNPPLTPRLITPMKKKSQNFPPTKSHSCFPQKNQISLAVTPQKTFFGKNIKMHTTLKPKVSIVM